MATSTALGVFGLLNQVVIIRATLLQEVCPLVAYVAAVRWAFVWQCGFTTRYTEEELARSIIALCGNPASAKIHRRLLGPFQRI